MVAIEPTIPPTKTTPYDRRMQHTHLWASNARSSLYLSALGLRSLNVSWCMRVTDTALEVIACDLGQLQELILDRCIHVSDVGVGYLSTLSSLRTLSIRWCTHVHDAGMQHVCSMRQLRVLRLSGCTHISAEALSNLTQLRHLSELELTNCPGGTEELHTYLSERLPRCTVYNWTEAVTDHYTGGWPVRGDLSHCHTEAPTSHVYETYWNPTWRSIAFD